MKLVVGRPSAQPGFDHLHFDGIRTLDGRMPFAMITPLPLKTKSI